MANAPSDAKIFHQYAIGKATPEEVHAALLNALKDPRYMMRWFAEHFETMSSFSQCLREPAKLFVNACLPAIDALKALLGKQHQSGSPTTDFLKAAAWRAYCDDQLVATAHRLVGALYPQFPRISSVERIAECCPGLTTVFYTLCGVYWRSLTAQPEPKPPTPNDDADCMHAFYAPYVSIFRADRSMAPIIATNAKPYGTQVVGKIADLPAAINGVLGA